jgi:hypothetical protein
MIKKRKRRNQEEIAKRKPTVPLQDTTIHDSNGSNPKKVAPPTHKESKSWQGF